MRFLREEIADLGKIVVTLPFVDGDLAFLVHDENKIVEPDTTGSSNDMGDSEFQICEFFQD